MTSGFDELSLALFTTLSPASVVAFICMAVPLLFANLEKATSTNLNRLLAIPFSLALVGFIASATHLGTPANALHVFSGIGRSPLSNEVLGAVAFLFLGGSYWMMAFKEHFPTPLAKTWLGLTCLAGIALIIMTSLAYSVETVPTWNSPFTPVNFVLTALFAGPLLAMFSCALVPYAARSYSRAMLSIASIAFVVGTVVLFVHNTSLGTIANNEITASSLVPHYFVMIFAHFGLGILGLLGAFFSTKTGLSKRSKTLLGLAACLFAFLAAFIVRLMFYLSHMTVGF